MKALMKRPADLTSIAARRGGAFPAGDIARGNLAHRVEYLKSIQRPPLAPSK
jgi:hypothetical protein